MSTDLGTAYVSVMPSMKGFGSAVESGLSGVDTTSAGKKMGEKAASGFAGGMASQGVVIGAASALASKAFDAVSSSAGRAISRVDTMNNFPKIMENMNVGADEAEAAIGKLSDKLTGLPTALDTAVSSVQRFALKNNDLAKSTDMFLAVNDAILAGGQSMGLQSSALEQLSQAYSKGQMDMMEWRTLQQAMPAQLKQVADYMGISIEQLGAGLRHAKDDVNYLNDISMDEFIGAIMQLDTEGVNGMKNFAEQAKTSTAGIQTSMENFQTSIVRGVANVIDAIGQENISGAINFLGSQIGGIFKSFEGDAKAFASFMTENKDAIMGLVSTLANVAPVAIKAWAAFKLFHGGKAVFSGIGSSISNLASRISGIGESIFSAGVKMESAGIAGSKAFLSMGSALGGVSAGVVGGVVAGIALLAVTIGHAASAYERAQKHQENFSKSTTDVQNATLRLTGVIDGAKGSVENLSDSTKWAARDFEALWEAQAKHAESIVTIADNTDAEVASLTTAQQTISELANKNGLLTEEQGKLQAAIEIVNDALGTNYQLVDAANGVISDSAGEYDEARSAAGEYKDEIYNLIEAKKQEVRIEGLTESLKEMYAGRAEAAKEYGQAVKDVQYYEKLAEDAQPFSQAKEGFEEMAAAARNTRDEAAASLESWDKSIRLTESNLGTLADQSNETAQELSQFANKSGLDVWLEDAGKSLADFQLGMESAGISVSDLSGLSQEQLATLAYSFDGTGESITNTLADIGMAIDETNAKELKDKSAEVTIEEGQLIDAQGNLYIWNGTDLKRQDGEAIANDTKLIDAQGRLYVWNNTTLKPQSATVWVNGADAVYNLISYWNNWWPSSRTVTVNTRSAHGDAAGGFYSLHANGGFITNGSVSLGRDRYGITHIAGEDGREWVQRHADGTTSIIPIENEKYLKPYADIISSMIGVNDGPSVVVNMNLNYDASDDAQQMLRDIERGLQDYLNLEA